MVHVQVELCVLTLSIIGCNADVTRIPQRENRTA